MKREKLETYIGRQVKVLLFEEPTRAVCRRPIQTQLSIIRTYT